jgi:hypothetical protein
VKDWLLSVLIAFVACWVVVGLGWLIIWAATTHWSIWGELFWITGWIALILGTFAYRESKRDYELRKSLNELTHRIRGLEGDDGHTH